MNDECRQVKGGSGRIEQKDYLWSEGDEQETFNNSAKEQNPSLPKKKKGPTTQLLLRPQVTYREVASGHIKQTEHSSIDMEGHPEWGKLSSL